MEFSFKNIMIKGIFAYICIRSEKTIVIPTLQHVCFPSYVIFNLTGLSCLTQWVFYFILKFTSIFCSLCNILLRVCTSIMRNHNISYEDLCKCSSNLLFVRFRMNKINMTAVEINFFESLFLFILPMMMMIYLLFCLRFVLMVLISLSVDVYC